MRIVFLGTGGGGPMMQSQARKTGGIFVDAGVKFVIDPGPGSLVHAHDLKLYPEKWDGLFVSHLHPDNSSDANALIDCMKSPFLVAEEHCVYPKDVLKSRLNYYPCISVFHQNKSRLYPVKGGEDLKIDQLSVRAVKAKHDFPTVGFVITSGTVKIGYPADGFYYPGQEKSYEGCDLLILNVLIPKGKEPETKKHMSVDDAITLVKNMTSKPKLVVIQHLSFWMIQSNIWKQVKIISDATKVRTLHAEDFMEIDLETMETKILKKDR